MVTIAAKKVKAIFLDFWGTIVENGVFPSPVRQIHRILRLGLSFSEYIQKFEEIFMTKCYDNLTDNFKNVTKEFNVNPPEFVYEKLVGVWNKNTLLSKPFTDTIEALEELKKDYKLVLVSNTDSSSVPQLLEKFDLKKYFDEIVLSCDVGLLKTDGAIYTHTLKKLKLKPADVVVVGDSVPTDIEGAAKAGIRGILIDRNDRREFEDKITTLTNLKEKING